ncbi:MAG: 6-phosphofructokinase [Victivallaceae bacterium]|nr:6-phosphofructokinase [Victivallaceae bacterium]
MAKTTVKKTLGILTSGGDAQGMNAAVRAAVRWALVQNCEVYAIYEGYQGMVDNIIKPLRWESVSSIMQSGGTVIGTARCREFRERPGRLRAAENLLKYGIDNLIVIGGDGSLTGADIFAREWPELLAELLAKKKISALKVKRHPQLRIVGMVGSIDNDMADTDMTLGADSALHRITEAIDALSSTAHSHQRIFIVEVMGRNCGYLAAMSAIATGASYVFIPESPPPDGWRENLYRELRAARSAGRRDSIIIVAEGARDRHGRTITSAEVKEVLDRHMGLESRVTILGHVQRGGEPSAFDRYLGTVSGVEAVRELLRPDGGESKIVVTRNNRIETVSLCESVAKTHAIAEAIRAGEFDRAMRLRGSGWEIMNSVLGTLSRPAAPAKKTRKKPKTIALITCGWPAPGMNNALRTAVRLGLAQGYRMLGIRQGAEGLIYDRVREFAWMDVEEWVACGGSKLEANRTLPEPEDFPAVAAAIRKHKIDGLLMIGGWSAYRLAAMIDEMDREYPDLDLPVVCVPASINNNLPGSELAIGADTALNTIVQAVDKIKNSADTSRRAFLVEVMGRYCGYLAAMSGLATGAEYIYLHEQGIDLKLLQRQLKELTRSFRRDGRNIALLIRNEHANTAYTTDFIAQLFTEEAGGLFDVRKTILGPMQQGGTPTPFDRIQGTRLAYDGMLQLFGKLAEHDNTSAFIGFRGSKTSIFPMRDLAGMVSCEYQRPVNQWWESLLSMVTALAIRPR